MALQLVTLHRARFFALARQLYARGSLHAKEVRDIYAQSMLA
jgi:hypothetical protein